MGGELDYVYLKRSWVDPIMNSSSSRESFELYQQVFAKLKTHCNQVKDADSPETLEHVQHLEELFNEYGLEVDAHGTLADLVSTPGYLTQLSGFEACVVIIDSYRLRKQDEYAMCKKIPLVGFEGYLDELENCRTGESLLVGFEGYLDELEKCGIILPPVWHYGFRRMCTELATEASEWSLIELGFSISEHYKDDLMPLRLRMIAEKVVGKHLGLNPLNPRLPAQG